jgi:porin
LTWHQSTGSQRRSGVAAAIGLRSALAVIAAATLTFAQAPTEARSVLMSSDQPDAAFPAASGPTANADVQPLQKPTDDLVTEPALSFGPHETQNRVRKLYLPISMERIPGIHKRGGGPEAGFLTSRGRKVALAMGNKGSFETTISGPLFTVIPKPGRGTTTSCNVVSNNTPGSASPLSLVDAAPNLVPFFNNGPIFGLPGTIDAGLRHRTQLIGDPNCKRSDLANRGVFIDLYSTSAYQNVMSGGLKTGNSYLQNTQLSINVDTHRAGLWPGGLFHFTVQSRYGSSPANTFTAGTFAPEYTGLELPAPFLWQDTWPSDYFLMQSVSEKFSVILGKINGLFIADQTLFGDRFRYYFANSNFIKNPIYNNFFNTMTLAAVGVWTPAPSLTVAGGVHDPFTEPNNLAKNAFHNGEVNLYVQGIFTYMAGGLPGQIVPAFNWSNESKIDLESPFGQLSPEQIPQALDVLLNGASPAGLPTNFKKDSSFSALSNFSQYLFLKEEGPAVIAEKLRTAQPLRGIGVFGRFGYAGPAALNTVDRAASVALLARGLLDSRPYDSFGTGFYYNGISKDFRNSIAQLTDGMRVKNENGIEVFYDFAITPAININAGYQHIWNPLVASVIVNQNHADLVLARLNVVW